MIVHFVYPSGRQRTGGVTVLYHFANGLARRGHEVHFLHGPKMLHRVDDLSELPPFPFEPAVEHHLVDSLDDPSVPEGDIVLLHEAPERLGLPAAVIQGFRMLPDSWERAAFRARAPKICVSSWLTDVGRLFGVPDEQLWYVPLGLDLDTFRPRRPAGDRPHDVALLWHPFPQKGYDDGLAALELLAARRPDLRPIVFGMEPTRQPLPTGFHFVEGATHEELAREVYSAVKVFLQPSIVEGFGYTAVEAMACGAALVTTDNGGSKDYAFHLATALVTDVGAVEAMADAVEWLLDDEPLRAKLATAGVEHVQRFDWERSADILEGRLESYLADPDRYRAEPGESAL